MTYALGRLFSFLYYGKVENIKLRMFLTQDICHMSKLNVLFAKYFPEPAVFWIYMVVLPDLK